MHQLILKVSKTSNENLVLFDDPVTDVTMLKIIIFVLSLNHMLFSGGLDFVDSMIYRT